MPKLRNLAILDAFKGPNRGALQGTYAKMFVICPLRGSNRPALQGYLSQNLKGMAIH